MKKQLFSLLSLLMLCIGMTGQVASYSFSQGSTAYSPVSATGATTLHATGWDDGIASATIPFNFAFAGATYTSCSVNTNGYLTFGTTTSSTSGYTPISGTTGYDASISAFGRDLIDGATGNAIIYNTLGTAPNRTFVVQWTNCRRYSGGAIAGDSYNFQIILNEGGGVASTQSVTILYGACTSTATALTVEAGLRGLTNADYNNRTTTTNWASTIAGTSNSASCSTNATLTPVSGLAFIYSPPAACIAPTAQATNLIFGGTTNTVSNGTLTPVTSTLTSYLVVRTTGSVPTAPVNGTAYTVGGAALGGTIVAVTTGSTYASIGLTGNTNYSYFIYTFNNTACSGGPLYNSVSPLTGTVTTCPGKATALTTTLVTTSSFNLGWTAPAGTASPITYSVEVSTNAGFTGTVTGSPFLVAGPTTSLSITGLNQLTTYYYRITTTNGCNIASTTAATVQTLPTCPTPTALNTSTITGTTANFTWTPTGSETAWDLYYGAAPLTAPNATTVPTATSSATTYSATGLYSATSYTVYVRAHCSGVDQSLWSTAKTFSTVTTCTVPAGLATTTVSGTSQTFSWTAGTGTAWDVYYGTQPLTVPSHSTVPTATTSTNSYTATGLYSGTGYAVYVRANCGAGDVSNWSAIKNFTTVITCTVPTAVTVSGITNSAATYSWTSAAPAFDVYYGSATTVPNATTVPTATTATNSYTATGLTALTGYSLYVRAQCSVGNMSTWTAVSTFTTLCNAISVFPFTESVPATFPSCWAANESVAGASYHWESYTNDGTNGVAGPKAGTNFMRLNVYNASATYNTYNLISPTFVLPATAKQIRYNYFLGASGYKGTTGATGADPYPLVLQISTNSGATWTSIYNHSTSNSTFAATTSTVNWQSNTIILGTYTSQTVIFRFVATSNYGSGICNQGLDEFIIEDAPACAPPTALTVTNIAGYVAKLGWTAPSTGSPANYDWEVRTTGAPGTGGAIASGTVTAPTTTANVTGLAPTTSYSVYVRTDCGGGTFSAWTSAQTFTTTVSCPAPTSLTLSAVTPSTAVATWTAGGVEASWFVSYIAPTTTASVSTPSYSLTGLTPSTNYTVQVRAYCGVSDTSSWTVTTFMTPCLPPTLTSTTPGSRCGIGTTTLGATAGSGVTLQWYANATGGTAVATGSVFTTPTISTTTNYYVSATGGLSTSNLGKVSTTGADGTNTSGAYLVFDAYTNFTLNSVVIYPGGSGAGTVVIALQNSSGVTMQTATVNATGNSTAIAQTVPVNFNITPGTSYRLVYLSSTGGVTSMYRDYSVTVPFPYTLPGVASITNGSLNGYYYYFYNWSVSTGCESNRTAVAATVSAPPALTLSTATTVCGNVISTVSVTSTLSNYDSYIWAPVTNLYTDAAATVAYTGGTATTVYYRSAVAGSTTYTVSASNTGSGCANLASTTLSTQIPVISATANPTVVCSASTVTLIAQTNVVASGSLTIGAGSTTSSSSGSPFYHSWGGAKVQYIYTAAELTALGLHAGNITSFGINVTAVGIPYEGFTINAGTTAQSSFATANTINGLTQVYLGTGTNNSYLPTVGVNTFNFSTPINWNGTDNVVISICWSNATTGGSSSTVKWDTYATSVGMYIYADSQTPSTVCGATTTIPASGGSSTTTGRPQTIFNGQIQTLGNGTLTWQWNPGAVNSNTAVVTPTTGVTTTTSSYTITGTDPATTCSNTAVVSVTVNPVPTVPVATNATQCGLGVSTASVSGGTAYRWYATSTSTTVLQSGASANYTTAINSTTTWYVSSYNANCESGRIAVTETVTVPDAITAASTSTAVCPGQSFTLTATHIGSTNNYTYAWTAIPSAGSGIPTSVAGITTAVTPTTPGTRAYLVTASDATAACTATASINVTAYAPPAISASGTPSVLCSGSTVTLTATTPAIGAGTVAIGNGTSLTGTAEELTAFCSRRQNYRMQTVYTAAELTAANLTAGNITSIAYNITTIGDGATNANYTVKCGTTTATAFTDYVVSTGFTTVLPATSYTHAIGLNMINFSTPFNWDGVSNIVVEVSHDGPDLIYNSQTYYTTTPGNTIVYGYNNAVTGTPSTERLNIIFGGQTTIQSVGSYAWQWNPGAVNSNTTTVTPTATGTTAHPSYTITAMDPATTCSNTAVVTLTVNPIPTVSISASTSSLCSGNSASLTASGAATYSWMPAGGASTVAVVSPTANTVYTVTGTSLGCSSTQTTSINVTATPTVVATISPSVICAGATVSLTATGAATYSWSPIGTTTASATATPTLNTTYSVTGTTAGCPNTKTVSVTVNHVPTLTISASSSTLCTAGASATLIATGTSTAYAWSTSASTASISVTPSTTTTYSVTGTNLCGTSTASTTVNVGTLPTVSAVTSSTLLCTGNSAVLTASGTATSYSWSTGATTMSVTISPTTTTTYSVTGNSVCGAVTATVVQNVSPCTGIEVLAGLGDISIYPNPAHDRVTVSISSYLASNNTSVEVTDALGRLVIKTNLNTDMTTVSLDKLEEGVYFFKVITDNQTVKIGKVVKQ